jgi:hypothetical protein
MVQFVLTTSQLCGLTGDPQGDSAQPGERSAAPVCVLPSEDSWQIREGCLEEVILVLRV